LVINGKFNSNSSIGEAVQFELIILYICT